VRVPKPLGASTTADAAILVFARAPIPGQAKTRLIPRLGKWRAARLQARLTLRALRTALAARCGVVELHAAPQRGNDFFLWCGNKFAVRLETQKGRDLGERMHRAIAAGLRRHRAVIVIGTDCPALAPRDLRRAARWLRGGCDAVLAPAEDGGYGLIGMRRPLAAAFSGVDWGSPSVYAQTLERFAHAGFRWRALRTIWDVDRPEDLQRLAAMRFVRLGRSAAG
jgi:rSAM/selenodomain-associated transferase 1